MRSVDQPPPVGLCMNTTTFTRKTSGGTSVRSMPAYIELSSWSATLDSANKWRGCQNSAPALHAGSGTLSAARIRPAVRSVFLLGRILGGFA